MQVNVTGHHVDVTTSLRDYVGNKLNRIERHADNVTSVHCILTVEKLRHKAEATAMLRGKRLHAEAVEDRRILKYKEKLQDHQGESIKKSDIPLA